MEKIVKKRFPLSILLILLFLAAIPTTAFYAQQAANQPSKPEYTEHWFGPGATVESVTEDFSDPDDGITVAVTDKDGNPKTSGLLVDGDLVTITDHQRNLSQTLIAIFPDSSSGPPSSSSPESKGSSAESSSQISSPAEESSTPSVPASSESRPETGSSSAPGTGILSNEDGYCKFQGPVKVESLENQLQEEGVAGSVLTVRDSSGGLRRSGAVCTGDTLTVTNPDGTLQNQVKAVIPGDLTRCGSPNQASCRALYSYLTESGTLRADLRCAADLNEDGSITTSDLLELKKMVAGDGED